MTRMNENFSDWPGYTTSDEKLPTHPWFDADPDAADSTIHFMYQDVIEIVEGCTDADSAIASLHQVCLEARASFQRPRTEVALVGSTGTGKSALINALLGEPGQETVAVASDFLCACTSAVIRYLYGSDDFRESKTIMARIHFRNKDTLCAMIKQHIAYFEASPRFDADYKEDAKNGSMVRIEAENQSRNALHTFSKLWGKDWTPSQLRSCLESPKFVADSISHMLNIIRDNKTHGESGSDSCFLQYKSDSCSDLLSRYRDFFAQASGGANVYWLAVEHVDIFLGNRLLKNGACLIDLPGLNDSDERRVALTNRLRDDASAELIVTRQTRLEADLDITAWIERSINNHLCENTILAVSHCDLAETNAVGALPESPEKRYYSAQLEWITKAKVETGPKDYRQKHILHAWRTSILHEAKLQNMEILAEPTRQLKKSHLPPGHTSPVDIEVIVPVSAVQYTKLLGKALE